MRIQFIHMVCLFSEPLTPTADMARLPKGITLPAVATSDGTSQH